SSLFLSSFVVLRVLHSFPTRRSSDLFRSFKHLAQPEDHEPLVFGNDLEGHEDQNDYDNRCDQESRWHWRLLQPGIFMNSYYVGRSEEHTSELQSLAYLVCRLLLEKKN